MAIDTKGLVALLKERNKILVKLTANKITRGKASDEKTKLDAAFEKNIKDTNNFLNNLREGMRVVKKK